MKIEITYEDMTKETVYLDDGCYDVRQAINFMKSDKEVICYEII